MNNPIGLDAQAALPAAVAFPAIVGHGYFTPL